MDIYLNEHNFAYETISYRELSKHVISDTYNCTVIICRMRINQTNVPSVKIKVNYYVNYNLINKIETHIRYCCLRFNLIGKTRVPMNELNTILFQFDRIKTIQIHIFGIFSIFIGFQT